MLHFGAHQNKQTLILELITLGISSIAFYSPNKRVYYPKFSSRAGYFLTQRHSGARMRREI